eukprot:2834670-Prorocentrum_lima.AAC.1
MSGRSTACATSSAISRGISVTPSPLRFSCKSIVQAHSESDFTTVQTRLDVLIGLDNSSR